MNGFQPIGDWDDAYANRDHIDDAQGYIDRWERLAAAFRRKAQQQSGRVEIDLAYGSGPRQKLDIFYPPGVPKGLFMFVHGGYWVAFDKNTWSHLAANALAQGWAVAVPSYSLCPKVKISTITVHIGTAIGKAANLVKGPIVLAGHSAGGQLVSRMGCQNNPLGEPVIKRVKKIISISGVHDLRPLRRLKLNQQLNLDQHEAESESPALLSPREGLNIDCVVGGSERPEFIRQNALLANIWTGLGAHAREIVIADKHHFNIIDELHDGSQGWLDLGQPRLA